MSDRPAEFRSSDSCFSRRGTGRSAQPASYARHSEVHTRGLDFHNLRKKLTVLYLSMPKTRSTTKTTRATSHVKPAKPKQPAKFTPDNSYLCYLAAFPVKILDMTPLASPHADLDYPDEQAKEPLFDLEVYLCGSKDIFQGEEDIKL